MAVVVYSVTNNINQSSEHYSSWDQTCITDELLFEVCYITFLFFLSVVCYQLSSKIYCRNSSCLNTWFIHLLLWKL